MALARCMAAAFMMASAVVQANQCSNGGECQSNSDTHSMLLLQTKLQMNVEETVRQSAYENLLSHLAQCVCPEDAEKSLPSLSTPTAMLATVARSRRYAPTKQFLEAVRHLKLPFFSRGGTLLSTLRNQGWMPWDYDSDFALAADTEEQAKLYVQELKDYLEGRDALFDVTISASATGFWVKHMNVSEWPVADGVIFYRRKEEEESGEKAWNERAASFECAGLVNVPARFLPAKFDDMTWEPFYDTEAPIPPNSTEFLDKIYGETWRCEAFNKCNSPDGALFKKDPSHCDMALYKGAKEYPLHTCGPSMQRGTVTV